MGEGKVDFRNECDWAPGEARKAPPSKTHVGVLPPEIPFYHDHPHHYECNHNPHHCIVPSGAKKLIAKIKEFNPKIAVFNGKGIYEVFSGQKEFIFGKQPEKIRDTETVGIFYFCYFCLS